MGASALVVAAAFAVAFAVLVSTTSTQTAEARDIPSTAFADNRVNAEPGDSVSLPGGAGATLVQFAIADISTATASFDSGGGQSLLCDDATGGAASSCDTVRGTAGDAASGTGIEVKLNIDADSADGLVVINRTPIAPASVTTLATLVINVKTEPKPASLTVKPASKTIAASAPATGATTPHQTTIVGTVKDDQTPAGGSPHQTLTFVTSLGALSCPDSAAVLAADNRGVALDAIVAVPSSQVCQVRTRAADDAASPPVVAGTTPAVTLSGLGVEGQATITVTHATLASATATVTLYGKAKTLSAEVEQSSIEVGGKVFAVLTVQDGAGFPVRGANPAAATKSPIVGPSKTAKLVVTDFEVNKLKDASKADASGNVAIPSCAGVDPILTQPTDADPPVTAGSTGTNDEGKCVVEVMAPKDDATTAGTNEAAARGIHTLNFQLGTGATALKASAEIQVAGKAASIESDAPEYVEPLSDTKITVTVRDDEDVLVGETAINVKLVAGDGLAEGAATKDGAKTKNGSASFSYAAGLSGEVVFRVVAGTGTSAVRDIITLTVGAPAPEPEPEPEPEPALSRTPSATGSTLVTFNGGTVDELSSVLTAACGAGVRAYATDYQGNWVTFIPSAPAVVNSPFNALFSEGIEAGTPLLVSNCGG